MGWIVLGGILGGLILLFLVIWYGLAPSNRWFTFVKEGSAKIIVRGKKFEKTLIQWEDHTFKITKDGRQIKEEDNWEVVEGKEPRRPLGGFRCYGFWPIKDVYIYNFKWTGIAEDGQTVHHPRETLDYVLLRDDVYWCQVENAEDIKLLPLTLEVLLTVRIINPYKACFRIQNWLETVINRMKPMVRDIITQDEFENWIKRKEALGGEIYQKANLLLTEFLERYGVEVRKIQVKEINPPTDYRNITLKKYTAERERDRIIVEADAERQRLETVAQGEKIRIETVYGGIDKFKDLGKLVRSLEAMEKSPLAASVTVQAIPGLSEMLRGVFGKPPEETTLKEIRELREMVEKLMEEKGG